MTPEPTSPRPHQGVLHRLGRVLGLWCVLLVAAGWLGFAAEAEAKGSASASKKKSGKKSSSSKKSKKGEKAAPVKIKPTSRAVDAAWGVTESGEFDAEVEGDEDDDDDDTDATSDPESELAAIERELLAQPVEAAPVEIPKPQPLPPKPVDVTPRAVRHEVIPGDTIEGVAARYGVDERKVKLWNGIKDPATGEKPKPLRAGTWLRIRAAVNPPPPRERLEVVVAKGDSWDSLAKKYEVDEAALKLWNRRVAKTLVAGRTKLTIWREGTPLAPQAVGDALASKLAAIKVRAGGISIGRPAHGRLVRGVELPDRPDLYSRRKPEESYGSTHAITQLTAAIIRFRHETGFARTISIGGISRPRGGRFRPHKSHQSGRDIDIRMPVLASAEGHKSMTTGDIDWRLTWKLMHAFIVSGEVEYIFLEHSLQKRLYKAARELGVSKEELAGWIQWPNKAKTNKGVVRHVKGHKVHFHVRIRCAPHEKHCVTVR